MFSLVDQVVSGLEEINSYEPPIEGSSDLVQIWAHEVANTSYREAVEAPVHPPVSYPILISHKTSLLLQEWTKIKHHPQQGLNSHLTVWRLGLDSVIWPCTTDAVGTLLPSPRDSLGLPYVPMYNNLQFLTVSSWTIVVCKGTKPRLEDAEA